MGARDCPCDGQPKARAAAVSIARAIESVERAKCLLFERFWNARAVIVDLDHYIGGANADAHIGLVAIFESVVEEIAKTSADRDGSAQMTEMTTAVEGYIEPAIGKVVANTLEYGDKININRRLRERLLPSETQDTGDHALHIAKIGEKLPALAFVLNVLSTEPQTRDGGAQIMRDGREHLGAIFDEPLQPHLHLIKGTYRPPDVDRTLLSNWRGVDISAETNRGFGESLKWGG
jgi:hypothetical protein